MVKIKGGESQSNATVYVQMYKDAGFFHAAAPSLFLFVSLVVGFVLVGGFF